MEARAIIFDHRRLTENFAAHEQATADFVRKSEELLAGQKFIPVLYYSW
jgi:hypothetical protein